MRKILLVCVVLAAACGKKDDCQRLVDKMMPIMTDMAKSAGKPVTDADKDKFLAECRKDDKMKNDPTMKCILDASGDDAIKACMTGALGDYTKKAKKTEADLQLNKLSKSAKIYFNTESKFPEGKAAMLPAAPCCSGPDHKCAVSDAWAKDPVWQALDFQIDEPNLFQYTYEAKDATHATATAVGDLDCDGTAITYTLTLTAENGNAAAAVTAPPPNAD
jgi:hypothetical protein